MADEKTEKAPAKKPAASKSAAAKDAAEKPAAKKAPAKAAAEKAEKPAAKATAAKAEKPAAAKAEKPAAAKAEKPAAAKAPAKAASTKAAADKAEAAEKPAAKKAPAKKAAEPKAKVSTLKMHHLRPAEGAHTPKTRVGRGEGSKGKTAGRGTKGTGARNQVPAAFEGGQTPLHMRIPKMRGFKNPFKVTYQVVNVAQIAELFPKGGEVTKADLVAKGAVRKNQPVKVLGDGEISVKVKIVDADKVSQSAKAKIEAAGGSVN